MLALVIQVALGVLLTLAALGKFAAAADFRRTLGVFGIRRHAAVVGVGLSVAEFGVGIGLVFGIALPWSVLGAAALFGVFACALAARLLSGVKDEKCGCFGRILASRISWALVTRNVGFALASLGLLGGASSVWLGTIAVFAVVGSAVRLSRSDAHASQPVS